MKIVVHFAIERLLILFEMVLNDMLPLRGKAVFIASMFSYNISALRAKGGERQYSYLSE